MQETLSLSDGPSLQRGPVLSVLVPVLSRPQNAKPLADSLAAATTVSYELIFLCSDGDYEEITACHWTGGMVAIAPFPTGPGNYAKKINYGYTIANGVWLFTGADDLHFEPGWDMTALSVAERMNASVVGTNDLANPEVKKGNHATHFLIARSYIENQGGTVDGTGAILHEGYDHQCIDLELLETARARGQWAMALDSHVRHLHPFFDKSVAMDPTYEKALAKGKEDRQLFFRRRSLWT